MTTPEALTVPAAIADARLRVVLSEWRHEWIDVDPLLDEIIDRLEMLVLAGGKRVRPAMAYWGFMAGGGQSDDPRFADMAAALELLQGFALFHDDVMDGSLTRRGTPTAHIREIERHEQGGWIGEARRYGEAVAILAGDVSLVLSDVLLADVNADVRSYWNQLRVEVNLGQFLDVVGTARGEVGLATAERIIDYKTARYTIVRPLQMGAALAGRADLAPGLEAVGRPLGIAFQLRDDMLGVFGETAITGKPVGDDLIEAKPTPLLARARSLATDRQLDHLSLIGRPLSADQIRDVQQTMIDTGAVAEVEDQIDELTAEAVEAIGTLELGGDAAPNLVILSNFLARRSS